jgi:protein-arginine kinase activator protein McsA
MTDKEIEKLADLVVKKLLYRQEQYDQNFMKMITDHPEDHEIGFMTKHVKTDEDLIAVQLDRLDKLLSKYILEENYIEASRIQKEIERLKNL